MMYTTDERSWFPMKTVKQMAQQTGISIRTLHHYDAIGLLRPTQVTEAGYRLYDDAALERLYLILLFRELGFPLKKIQHLLDAPDFDRNQILDQQVRLLEQQQTHLGNLVNLARGIKLVGVNYLEMHDFNFQNIDDYAAQAKTLYGKSEAYQQCLEKTAGRTQQQNQDVNRRMMDLFVQLGQCRHLSPDSAPVQQWVKNLQDFITENYYTCTRQILLGLGDLYAGGGSMTENIDKAGGEGTGAFARQAIQIYCQQG